MLQGAIRWLIRKSLSAARPYRFGDGGKLKNQGIIPLLRRRLPKILAFVNTETQLSLEGPKREVVVDSDLAGLIGVEWSASLTTHVPISLSFRFSQVISLATFNDLGTQLRNGARAGDIALAVQTNVQVLASHHYRVLAYTTVSLWSYLHPVTFWWGRFSDWVKGPADLETWNNETFPNNYTLEQPDRNNHQVSLLPNLPSWNVAEAAAVAKCPSKVNLVRTLL